MADEKKGITVKIDANLHAEIREYLERHEGMTMAEFITLAVDDELHPKIQQKEGNSIDFMSGEYTINNLNNIKSKTVGDGQHGTARWANKAEIRKTYRHIPFTPKKWRKQAKQNQTPTMTATAPRKLLRKKAEPTEEALPQGIVVGCKGGKHSTTAMIDTGDVHVLMIGAAGVGKTAFWLYPCIEYACASGMSFLSTDTKGDVMRNYGNIAKDYGYKVSVIDLRNPTRSNGNNILYLVNKYTDLYAANLDQIVYKAKAEKYAKIISKTIILSGMDAASFGQNAYFYDAAEGLLTATILLVAEFCAPEKRHIVSVFKVIQELLAPSKKKGKNQFQQLMELLPNEHKAKWFAGAALNTAEQSMASVMSTALSRLIAFLDTELEQLLCFDTEIDAETFCNEKSAIFVIMPEENPNTFFMISLIIQQLYREILAVADENGGKLKNRCVFFCDEFGTLPKIESAEMMFSASRSRRLQIVPIIQSFAQLEKNYGKEGAEIIVDNTQDTIFGGFAPNSSSAETLSKALGSRTVMSGSVSRSKNDPSQSLQMIERPLLTPDELKSLPKGDFIVMKTGAHPMRVHLKLFFKWGIEFDEDNPYAVPDQGNREVKYADKKEIQDGILEKYPPEWKEETPAPNSSDGGGQAQQDSQKNEPQRTTPKDKNNGGNPIRTSPPKKETAPDETEAEIIKDLVETEVQSNEPS
jgi:type IV secretion system protein VirD4